MRKAILFVSIGVAITITVIAIGMNENTISSKEILALPGKIIFQTDRERAELSEGSYQAVMFLKNGQMRPLAAGVFPRFSKDGNWVLYKRENTLYLLDVTTQQAKSLDWTAKYSPFDFDLSPDKQWLVFTSDHVQLSKRKVPQLNLMVAKIDGSDLVQLTDVNETIVCPRWSPNGQWILFDSPFDPKDNKQIGGLYKIHPDGSALQRIFGPYSYSIRGTWSPDGQRITFDCFDPNERRYQILLVNADGTELKKVASLPNICHSPVFSPDGTQILFLINRPNSLESGSNLYVINVDGTNQCQVTAPHKIKKYGRWRWATDRNPDWAP